MSKTGLGTVAFDQVKFGLFLIEFVHAEMEGNATFWFWDEEWDVAYARSLIIHLMKKFKEQNVKN